MAGWEERLGEAIGVGVASVVMETSGYCRSQNLGVSTKGSNRSGTELAKPVRQDACAVDGRTREVDPAESIIVRRL